jgi:site-specific DNA recombinase
MRTAIGYVRVSTEMQASEGVSLEAQKKRIQLWAEANGYKVVAIHADVGFTPFSGQPGQLPCEPSRRPRG